MQPRASVVVLDLDNTLWDWVRIWYNPFRAMLDEIVRISGIPEEDLYEPVAAVHRRHGTSEYAFLIEELEVIRGSDETDKDVLKRFEPAVHAYRDARRAVLQLYPTVFETLWKLRDLGVLVVGYTESQEFYTHYRLRRLNLDGLLDYLYSPADHDLPPGLTPERIRKYRADTYRLMRTLHRNTPKGARKPNPEVLKEDTR